MCLPKPSVPNPPPPPPPPAPTAETLKSDEKLRKSQRAAARAGISQLAIPINRSLNITK